MTYCYSNVTPFSADTSMPLTTHHPHIYPSTTGPPPPRAGQEHLPRHLRPPRPRGLHRPLGGQRQHQIPPDTRGPFSAIDICIYMCVCVVGFGGISMLLPIYTSKPPPRPYSHTCTTPRHPHLGVVHPPGGGAAATPPPAALQAHPAHRPPRVEELGALQHARTVRTLVVGGAWVCVYIYTWVFCSLDAYIMCVVFCLSYLITRSTSPPGIKR